MWGMMVGTWNSEVHTEHEASNEKEVTADTATDRPGQ